jgi:hypothetical protein
MTYYVLVIKNKAGATYTPTYEIRTEKPTGGKFVGLEPGDCVDAFKCFLSTDGTYIDAQLYRVSNIDDAVIETLTERFQINRP